MASDEMRTRAAEALADWQMRHAVVCEHTQIIDYGAAADAVTAVLLGDIESRVLHMFTTADEKGVMLDALTSDHLTRMVMHAIRGEEKPNG